MLTTERFLTSFKHPLGLFMNREDELAQFIRAARLQKGLSRTEAVNELTKAGVKVSYGYLNKIELGDRSLASANIELREGLRRLYGLSRNEWAAKTGLYTPDPSVFTDEAHLEGDMAFGTIDIPEYDLLSAGPGGRGGEIIGYVPFRPKTPGEYVAYRISGDSMSPRIGDGDTVVIKVHDYASPGNIIVCWTPDDGMVCKYLKEITSDGVYLLTSHNSAYAPIWTKEIKIYGLVVQRIESIPVINGNH
jgi:phage repressor protein C with HTH and peptisase S24 domain